MKVDKHKTNYLEANKEQQNTPTAARSRKRFDAIPSFPNQRIWSRSVLILGLAIYLWFNSSGGHITSLARQKEVLSKRGQQFACHKEYLEEIHQYAKCVPKKCGRFVSDTIVTQDEIEILVELAKIGINVGGSSGGASILDIDTGALSLKKAFVNFYSLPEAEKILTRQHLLAYNSVKSKIRREIANSFHIEENSLHLTSPTFFSKLTNDAPKSENDIYWRIHVDKETYEFFHFTSLLYLSDYEIDFHGGRLMFLDNFVENWKNNNVTVEPRKGRVVMFTSGAENTHYVERVTSGMRYALTVSFTCNSNRAINPSFELKNK